MITTQKHPGTRNLHLQTDANYLRKSILNSSFPLNQNNSRLDKDKSDESERNKRRSKIDIQKRMATTSISPTPPIAEQEIRTHFRICLKMFAENKISSKNVWNLKIIDYMRAMLLNNKMGRDSLQLGSASLDVSTKVYGIRVDDIHSDGLKLASSMARISHNPPAASNFVESNDGSNQVLQENSDGKRKKKQRRLSASTKHTIVKDPSSLLADIHKLEYAIFQTRSNAEASTMDNYFTNRLLNDSSGCKFMLLSNKIVWDDNDDPTLDGGEKYPFKLDKAIKLDICPDFKNFEVDNWDSDNDEEAVTNNSLHNSELVLDDKGIPIAELDGSVHTDIFDAPESIDSDADKDGEAPQIMSKEIANVNELRPRSDNCISSEYVYQSLLKFNSKSLHTWAGPSHWKLKHLQRAKSRFSGAADVKVKANPRKRRKIESVPIDFRKDWEMVQDQNDKQLAPSKNISMPHATDTSLIPLKYKLPKENFLPKLLMKNVDLDCMKKIKDLSDHCSSKDVEYETGGHNENVNDSMDSLQNNMDDNGGHSDEEDVVMNSQNTQYLGENLIEQADIVPKFKMGYVTQAKKMDMKKLKQIIWQYLVNETGEVTDETCKKKVQKVTFGEVYSKLPSLLNKKMADELSCSLAFIAILHLSNENNLKLTGTGDLSNFSIEQG